MAIALVTAGCSDDSSSDNKDGGTKDVTVLPDGPVTPTPDGYVPTPDGYVPTQDGYVPTPDGPVTNTCEQACMDEAPFLCLDAGNGCVECTTDSHCLGNPNSFGPACDSSQGWCTCSGASDCTTNPNGALCDADYTACSCKENSDCPTGKACSVVIAPADPGNGDPGLKTCGDACTDNSGCTADASKPFCDTRSGSCVACLTDGDCTADAELPYCGDVGGGEKACVECTDNTQCAGSKYGDLCDQNFCGCTDATNCAYPKAWGGGCVEHSTSFGTYTACGCDNADNTQCAGITGGSGTFDNAYGAVCDTDFNVCSCTADGECSDTDWDTCGLVAAGQAIQQCQEGCATDAECLAVDNGLNACDVASGRCIECKIDTDCSDGVCNTNTGACVACLTDGDCTDSAPKCSPTNECVSCLDNADCADNIYGTKCGDDGSCGCALDADCGTAANGPTCEGADDTTGELGYCNCTPPATGSGDPDPCAEGGNTNGKVCQEFLYGGFIPINGCGCNDATADCASGQKCGLSDSFAMWDSCQEPCAGDDDCKGEGLGVCDTSSALCIGCADNADCTYVAYEGACNAESLCVECTATTDCGANSLGPNCNVADGWCECASDAECVGNAYGTICNADLAICGCDRADSAGTCPNGKTCTGDAWGEPICE